MPLAGKNANLRIASGVATTSTGQAATRSTGAGALTGFVQITSTSRRHIDPDTVPAVYRVAAGSTTLVASSDYTVNPVQGKFQWIAGDPSTGTYNVDMEWLTATQLSGGREWQINIEADMFEVSEFGSGGWKQFQPNLNGASLTIGKYWTDATFFDLLNTDSKFVVECVVDGSEHRYEGFVRISGDQITTPTDGLVGESISATFDGPVYYST